MPDYPAGNSDDCEESFGSNEGVDRAESIDVEPVIN
jgi:hypothetical protein